MLRLQSFNFTIVYKPGKYNIADPLSRRTTTSLSDTAETDQYIKFVASQATPTSLTPGDIEVASSKDPIVQQVRKAVTTGTKAQAPADYKHIFEELSVVGFMVLRGCRILIPGSLRQQVLTLAHEGHQGIAKCKERLRSKVWWPGIDKEIERICRACHSCQITQPPPAPPPMTRTQLPSGPWMDIAADLLGPLPSGEYLLVVVDYYSRYFEVDILTSIRSSNIINCLENMFVRYGVPEPLTTDNGPQFADRGFNQFLEAYGITHRTTPPMWPRANGEVERQNRTLLKAIRTAHAQGSNWKEDLKPFLLAYRTTPHSTTGVAPAEGCFTGR